jgi:hypothetical protein
MIQIVAHFSGRLANAAFRMGVVFAGLSAFAVPSPAQASQVTPVTAEAGNARIPEPGRGAWRSHVQQIWNGFTSRLERRHYEIFDPFADAGFDLSWEPRDIQADQPGRIAGQGVLIWHRSGPLPMTTNTTEARYQGEMVDGRPHGRGTFVDRSGLRYDGTWAEGLMEGEGHLLLPNGDVYRGGFKAGHLHGQGVFIDATGRVYDGGFSAGLRDGPAQVAEPDGRVYAGVWHGGVEDEPQRTAPAAEWAQVHRVQMRGPADLAIAVSVGPAVPQPMGVAGPLALGYVATSFPDRLVVNPDAPRLLNIWRGHENIAISDPLVFDHDRAGLQEYSILNYTSKYIKTVPLQFGLENRSTRPVAIQRAYLDVARSQVDMQPLLQSIELKPLSGQGIAFSIENYGWSPALNARLTVQFRNPAKALQSEPAQINLGEVSSVQQFSFAPAFAQFGVRVNELPRLARICQTSRETPTPGCLAGVIRSGVFGRLGDFVVADERRFGFRVIGQLNYEWKDADGRLQTAVAPFDALVPIGTFHSLSECEGSDIEAIEGNRPFQLAENRQRYQIPFPLQESVGAGMIRRWQITLDAAKSSNHDLRIVLVLADGQEVVSRNISLLLFHPKTYPASVRPFEGRC